MALGTIKTRATGATARLGRTGQPSVASVTGGELSVVTRPSEPGFNPLDLLYASLSACLVLSARIAASELGMLDKVAELSATVSGSKAADGPSRVERFHIVLGVDGDLDEAAKDAIVAAAETICTVSNTLRDQPAFEVSRADPH
ncbi:OsmC family protein [Labrys wisconsinensis]|uniref:OsmC-like protein n=1 Tax=Labrys wisconsinensis TaxID=425677 RepID=A0ABU0J3B0_9HYPH|nr:OsmC family protein [Labrys wisconsinensis]MDQ0468756.1 putative OsmC-like protein [Labrys wisconsinensis]